MPGRSPSESETRENSEPGPKPPGKDKKQIIGHAYHLSYASRQYIRDTKSRFLSCMIDRRQYDSLHIQYHDKGQGKIHPHA